VTRSSISHVGGDSPGIHLIVFLVFLYTNFAAGYALEDGRIGVLYVGDYPVRAAPFSIMGSDPLFKMLFVPASSRGFGGWELEDVMRSIRLYMPRTPVEISTNFDVIVLSDANSLLVSRYIDLMARAVSEDGLGLFMSGGAESFGGSSSQPSWGQTAIGQLLPTDDIPGVWVEYVVRMVITNHDYELIKSLPWDMNDPTLSAPIKWHHNPVTRKPGAEQLAHVVVTSGNHPLMVTWRLEKSRVFALTSEIHRFWEGEQWDYGYDLGCNLMIHLDDRPVPQDIQLVHAARSKMIRTTTRRALLMALLDFTEAFGANTKRMIPLFEEMDEAISQAGRYYLELHFDEMLQEYGQVESIMVEAEQEAVKLKNETLMWVHITEWLVVTGTAMTVGAVLWTLMVKRKLYKQVAVTRAS